MDRNHDGSINGGTELFGEGTNLANGQKASNGYQALAELDSNADGVVNTSDSGFADLMVWVDDNSDGVSASTELHSLSSLGITQLDLKAQSSTQTDNGNLVGLVSNYTTADGAVHGMADVWFQTSAVTPAAAVAPVAAQPISLQMPTPTLAAADASSAVAAGAPTDLMRTQVGSMVDAMANFGGTGPAGGTSADSRLPTPEIAMHAIASGTGVTGMVDAMKQFDANGQPLLSGGAAPSGQVATSLNTNLPRKPDTDILASS
jgi:hypothetical protein